MGLGSSFFGGEGGVKGSGAASGVRDKMQDLKKRWGRGRQPRVGTLTHHTTGLNR